MSTLNVTVKLSAGFQGFTTNCTLKNNFNIIHCGVHCFGGFIGRLINGGRNLKSLSVFAGHVWFLLMTSVVVDIH